MAPTTNPKSAETANAARPVEGHLVSDLVVGIVIYALTIPILFFD
jgi:hypothetical protein